jgi:hypothetical protein
MPLTTTPALCLCHLCCWAAQVLWAFARMEYRPPQGLLDAVLKVGAVRDIWGRVVG